MSTQKETGLYHNKVAVAVIKNPQGKVLIIKRKQEIESIDGGKLSWTFPGNGIDEKEEYRDAAARHTLEQTGYKIKVKTKISERIYHPFKNYLQYFECSILGSEPAASNDESVEEVLWVEPKELNKYFTTNIDTGVAEFLGI